MAKHEELIYQVKELIRNNRTGKALELLAKEQLSSLDKDLIILNGQYSKIKDDQRLGVIDDDLAQRRLNKINLHLLELSEKIGKSTGEKISSSLQKKEGKFNKWWIVVPVLLLLTFAGVYFVKSFEVTKLIEAPTIGVGEENTPIGTPKNPSTDSTPIIDTVTPVAKVHSGPIREKKYISFGLTVEGGVDKNGSAIILHRGLDHWKMLPSGAIVLSDNESLGLTVKENNIKNHANIILLETYDYWKILKNGKIVLKRNPEYGLTVSGQIFEDGTKIILHNPGSNSWDF